ncbi:MAG: ATP-binding protein [Acidimicrobiales bacterium]
MKLQARLALTVAAAASVAIFLLGTTFWLVAAQEQRNSVDRSLLDVVSEPRRLAQELVGPGGDPRDLLRPRGGGPGGVFDADAVADNRLFARIRITDVAGRVVVDEGLPFVEPSERPRVVTVAVDGERFRMAVAQVGDGRNPAVLQVARNVEDTEAGLARLRNRIVLVSLFGVGLAAALGALVARRLSRPIVEVATAARQLARQDMPGRIHVDRTDEVGDLAESFNQMLVALEVSREQQARLVGDASHELRTPLTSLRLKIDLLDSTPDLPAAQRQDLLSGAAMELERLSDLVVELVDLASDPSMAVEEPVPTDLGQLVADVAERVRRTTGRTIDVEGNGSQVPVRDRMVRRAVSNLLDNAIKYSTDAEPVRVVVDGTRITVHDRGEGIPEEDLDHVFDRFYRSPQARTRPGNGIGLAIVDRVARLHEGQTWAQNAPTGGAVVGFSVAPG